MTEFPPEESHPDYKSTHSQLVYECIERLALIARDYELSYQIAPMELDHPQSVINFASQLRARIKQEARNAEELAIQEQIIDSLENIMNQLIALAGLVKQLGSVD
jgi:hypothetical protein